MRPQSVDAWPSKSRVPGRRETSIEKSLAPIREAHQRVLAMAAGPQGRNREAKPFPPPESAGGKGEIKE